MQTCHVVIVGAGPRGLGVLERITAVYAERAPDWGLHVHLVDPGEPGQGTHKSFQPEHLLTNTVAGQLTLFTDESVRDGETGYVVEQEDAVALADRVIALLRDAELRERMSKAARADAEKRYALRVVADAHWELYEAVRREKGRG